LWTGGARARIFSTTGQLSPLLFLVLQFTSWTFTLET
jgi:hypothetical protein